MKRMISKWLIKVMLVIILCGCHSSVTEYNEQNEQENKQENKQQDEQENEQDNKQVDNESEGIEGPDIIDTDQSVSIDDDSSEEEKESVEEVSLDLSPMKVYITK